MTMIYAIVALFAVAAVLGIILISFVLRDKTPPKALAILHGLLAATALVLLIVHTINDNRIYVTSIVIFVLAALGGFIMIAKHLSNKPLPKWLAVVHGLTAVTGYIALLVNAFG
jgi:hypothetical protein